MCTIRTMTNGKPDSPRTRVADIPQAEAEERLLTATYEMVKVLPLAEVTTREIAKKAHLNVAHITRYFKNKDVLLSKVADQLANEAQETLLSEDPVEILRRLLTSPEANLSAQIMAYLQSSKVPGVNISTHKERWTAFAEMVSERQGVNIETAKIFVAQVQLLLAAHYVFGESTGVSNDMTVKIGQLVIAQLASAKETEKRLGWDK